MAWLLVQLKLRLLRNALRSSNAARTSFILSTFFAFVVAVGGFYVLAQFRGLSASVDLTTVIFTAFALGWLTLPIFAFGLDGTLDPAAVALYPAADSARSRSGCSRPRPPALAGGDLIALLGVTVGLASGPLGLLVAVVAVALPGAVLHHAGPAGDHQHGRRCCAPAAARTWRPSCSSRSSP